jgi:hypothetical protein
MAASQTKEQQQDVQEHRIPAHLLRQVNAARLPCEKFFVNKCRKGRRCPRSHCIDGSSDMNVHLPFTSRYMAEGVLDSITLRPPLTPAAVQYFSQIQKPCVLGPSSQWNSRLGKRMITYTLDGMDAPDNEVCEAASTSGFARGCKDSRSSETVWFKNCLAQPKFHGHRTSLKNALSVLASGAIPSSPGIAGHGVYSFACDSDQDNTALDVAWSPGHQDFVDLSGTYCALFVFKAHGILTNIAKDASLDVSPGATSTTSIHYSSHMGVIEYMSFTTTVDGLVAELSQQLDVLGYTQALHEALKDVKAHMESESETVSNGYDFVFLKNTVVTLNPKLVVPPSASDKDESGEKGNSGDSDVNFVFLKDRAIEPKPKRVVPTSASGKGESEEKGNWGVNSFVYLKNRAIEPEPKEPKLVVPPSASRKGEKGKEGDSGGHDVNTSYKIFDVDSWETWTKLDSLHIDRNDLDSNQRKYDDWKKRKHWQDFVDEKWTDWGNHWYDRAPATASESWGSDYSSSWPPSSSRDQAPPLRWNERAPAAATEYWGSASSYSWRPSSTQAQPPPYPR